MADVLPPIQETFDPQRSVKTIVQYFRNDNGDIIKETKEYRIDKRVIPSQMARRKAWVKFGAAKDDPQGGKAANTALAEVVTMQIIQIRQPEQEEKQEDMEMKSRTRAPVFVCRHCKGNHFTHQCPNRNEMEKMQELQERIRLKSEVTDDTIRDPQAGRPGHYVPPALRGQGATAVPGGQLERRSFDGYTIRVTNLPPDTTADDLRLLFEQFGRVTRVFPAKDRLTQQSRGFAFISYETAEQAKDAIYGVNGLRHNHVVLRVDWARPSAN